jgi:hypothetical protein
MLATPYAPRACPLANYSEICIITSALIRIAFETQRLKATSLGARMNGMTRRIFAFDAEKKELRPGRRFVRRPLA